MIENNYCNKCICNKCGSTIEVKSCLRKRLDIESAIVGLFSTYKRNNLGVHFSSERILAILSIINLDFSYTKKKDYMGNDTHHEIFANETYGIYISRFVYTGKPCIDPDLYLNSNTQLGC